MFSDILIFVLIYILPIAFVFLLLFTFGEHAFFKGKIHKIENELKQKTRLLENHPSEWIEVQKLHEKEINLKQSRIVKTLATILSLSLIANIALGVNRINSTDSQKQYNDGYTVGYNDGYDDGQSNRASIQSANDQWTDNDYESSSDYAENTVYVTDTGSKYHQCRCQYLRESCHEVSLSDAQSEGYTACSVCW